MSNNQTEMEIETVDEQTTEQIVTKDPISQWRFTLFFLVTGLSITTIVFYPTLQTILETPSYIPIVLIFVAWYIGRPIIAGVIHKRRTPISEKIEENNIDLSSLPSITVQLPAYNEEENIEQVIESITNQQYNGNMEIIVVDDGSTDNTWSLLQELAEKYDILRVFTKENEGIAPTRNFALEKGTNEIVITMDSDTILEENALLNLVAQFDSNGKVVGVASNVEILNDKLNWWTRAQSIEYLLSMEMARMFQSKFRHLMVISGGCGAYRRSVLEKVNGWNEVGHKYAEDFDLTIKAHERGRINFTPDATALTLGPTTLKGWWDQRMNWAGHGLRTVLHHRKAVLNPNFSLLGLFALPFKLVTSALLMWGAITFIMDIVTPTSITNTLMSIGSATVLGLIGTSGLALLLLGIVSTYVTHFSPLRKVKALPSYLLLYRPLHVLVRLVAFTVVLSKIGYEIIVKRIPIYEDNYSN